MAVITLSNGTSIFTPDAPPIVDLSPQQLDTHIHSGLPGDAPVLGTVHTEYISKYATGDGVTDVSSQVNNALSHGGDMTFDGVVGTVYLVGSTINIPSNTTIRIMEGVVVKAKSTLVGDVFKADGVDSVNMVGGTIDGSGASSGASCIDYKSCTNSSINSVKAVNAKGIGIFIQGTIGANCDNISIVNSSITNCGGNGVTPIYTKNFRFINNILRNNQYGFTSGASSQMSIIGNQFTFNIYDGLAVGDNCSYVTVIGNVSHDNGAEGVNIDGCNHSIVSGNTSFNNLIGIACWNRSPGNVNAGNNILSNNNVYGCYMGILLADGQPNCQINGNNVQRCGSYYTLTPSGSGNYGIYVTNVPNPIIANNIVSECTWSGFYMSAVLGGIIRDNYSVRNGRYGIELQAGTGLGRIQVKRNTIKENGDGGSYTVGLYNAGSTNIDIIDNHFIEERTTGYTQTVPIYSISTNSSVSKNTVYALVAMTYQITNASQKDNSWNSQPNPPIAGTWVQGDIIWNTNCTTGGYIGWVCTAGGSVGTWKGFGTIS